MRGSFLLVHRGAVLISIWGTQVTKRDFQGFYEKKGNSILSTGEVQFRLLSWSPLFSCMVIKTRRSHKGRNPRRKTGHGGGGRKKWLKAQKIRLASCESRGMVSRKVRES